MEKKKMNPKKNLKKIAIVAAAFACAALLPAAGAQAAKHPHRMMHAHHHGAPNPVVGAADAAGAIAGAAIGTAGAIAYNVTSPWAGPGWEGAYWAPSAWGDYECHSTTFGCRPYGAWTQH